VLKSKESEKTGRKQMTDPFPRWARWIAQNRMGSIFVFEHKPYPGQLNWLVEFQGRVRRIHSYMEYPAGYIAPHWRHSLDYLGDDDKRRR
jgi:hypothetical protein